MARDLPRLATRAAGWQATASALSSGAAAATATLDHHLPALRLLFGRKDGDCVAQVGVRRIAHLFHLGARGRRRCRTCIRAIALGACRAIGGAHGINHQHHRLSPIRGAARNRGKLRHLCVSELEVARVGKKHTDRVHAAAAGWTHLALVAGCVPVTDTWTTLHLTAWRRTSRWRILPAWLLRTSCRRDSSNACDNKRYSES